MTGFRLPLSAPDEGRLLLSVADVTDYLFLGDPPGPVDAVLVLGGNSPARVSRAAELVRAGLTSLVVISGGATKRPQPVATEAEWLARAALAAGIPDRCLVLERRASNTRENIIFSVPVLRRRLGPGPLVIGVSSLPVHMRRAVMTARRYFPPTWRVVALPADYPLHNAGNWWLTAQGREAAWQELVRIGRYLDRGHLAALAPDDSQAAGSGAADPPAVDA